MPKSCALLFLATLFLAGFFSSPPLAWAHRANVFAYVEGDLVRVECSFSQGGAIRAGAIEVFDVATGEILLTGGQTDSNGLFSFPVPEKAHLAGHGLIIRVNAGDGHAGEWRIDSDEFKAGPLLAGSIAKAASPPEISPSMPPTGTPPCTFDTPEFVVLDSRELERVFEYLLDKKLDEKLGATLEQWLDAKLDEKFVPVRRALAQQSGPGLRDIVGGIGWLIGLAGLAAWFRRRS